MQRGDVRDPDAVAAALDGADAVVHLAAYQDYLPDLATFFDVNVTGTALLYEKIVQGQHAIQKMVVASSQSVYGEGRYRCDAHGIVSATTRSEQQLSSGDWEVICPHGDRPAQWLPSDESSPNPTNAYGASKLAQEHVALTLGRRYDIPTTCFRYSITNGPWQSPRNSYSGICRIFVQRVLGGGRPVLYEDGLQVRDYSAVDDVVAANLLALDDPRTDFDVFNVGGPNVVTVRQYAELVLEVLGSSTGYEVPGIYRYGDTRHSVSSSDRLQQLGWRPTGDLRQVVSDYAAWFQTHWTSEERDGVDSAARHMSDLGVLRSASGGAAVNQLPGACTEG